VASLGDNRPFCRDEKQNPQSKEPPMKRNRGISHPLPSEEERLRTLNFLDSVIENIPSMIFIKDAETLKFARVNRACEEVIGFSRE
jgi:PAS domain-containing protein